MQELVVAGVGADHGVGIGHEEVVEEVQGVVVRQAVGGESRGDEVLVGRAVDIRLNLDEQARDEVDRAPKLGNFLEVQRHPEIILGAVKTDPRHRVFTRDVVGVIGLMLVPHQGQGDLGHRQTSPSHRPRAIAIADPRSSKQP